jgi:hypothetical protein
MNPQDDQITPGMPGADVGAGAETTPAANPETPEKETPVQE